MAAVIAVLATQLDLTPWPGAVGLALGLWLAFPVVLLAGSVFHERYPAQLAAIHAGDWLLKLLVIAIIVTVWT